MDRSQAATYPDDIDITMLWRAIGRSKGKLVLSVLLAGLIGYVVMSMIAPRYESTAEVLIERAESSYTRPKEERQQLPDSNRIDEMAVASQAEVITSRDILLRVTKDLQLAKNPEYNTALGSRGLITTLIDVLGLSSDGYQVSEDDRVLNSFIERLTVSTVPKSQVIRIDTVSETSELAAKAANAVARAYIEFNTAGQLRQDAETTSWLGGQIDDLRKAAEKADSELERFRAEAGLLSGQNNTMLNNQQLAEVNTQLTQARAQRTDAESRAKLIRQMLTSGDIEASPDVLKSASVQRLLDHKTQVQRQVAELSPTLLPGHPRMRQLYSELASINASLRAEAVKVVRSLDNEVMVAATRQKSLEASLADLSTKMAGTSDAAARLSVLEHEAKSRRAVYETYLDRLNDVSTRRDRPVGSAFARQISTAAPSSVPVWPKKIPFTLLIMFATLLSGLTWIIAREMMFASQGGYRVPMQPMPPFTPGDGPSAPIHVAGAMARASGRVSQRPVRLGSVSAIAQHLATRAQSIPGFRTVVTGETSGLAIAEEALQIARKLTSSERKVILIDWNTDGTGIAELIGAPHGPGLADLVASKATFEDTLHLDPKSAVNVMRFGEGQATMGDTAFEQQLALVLDALDEIYHHVVICGDRVSAARAFEMMQGRFDAGVIVRPEGMSGPVAAEQGRFLGFEVVNLEVIWLERAAASRQPLPHVQPPAQRGSA